MISMTVITIVAMCIEWIILCRLSSRIMMTVVRVMGCRVFGYVQVLTVKVVVLVDVDPLTMKMHLVSILVGCLTVRCLQVHVLLVSGTLVVSWVAEVVPSVVMIVVTVSVMSN